MRNRCQIPLSPYYSFGCVYGNAMTPILVLGQMDSHIIVIQLTATFVSRALDVWRGRVSPLRCTVSIQVICKVYPWTNHGHVLLSQTNKRAINGLFMSYKVFYEPVFLSQPGCFYSNCVSFTRGRPMKCNLAEVPLAVIPFPWMSRNGNR